jgi:hypothetical protein
LLRASLFSHDWTRLVGSKVPDLSGAGRKWGIAGNQGRPTSK